MYILVKNGVILAKSKSATIVSNGIALDEFIFGIPVDGQGNFAEPLPDIIEVSEDTIPVDFMPLKYCYTVADGFTLNANYVEYKSPEQKMTEQAQQIALMQKALDELLLG